jgi:hypothetical protein
VTRTDYAISDVLYDFLVITNDPRLYSFADPAASTGTIQPMPYGLENSDYQPTDVSFPNSNFVRKQDSKISIFSESQIFFMMAEAAQRGWTNEIAEDLFDLAISASMNQWGISDQDKINQFISQPNVSYDSENWKKSIAEQKWVALYTQGFEAWAEWRRLDFPKLKIAQAPVNPSEKIPLRFIYPSSEESLNSENYNAAVSMLGGLDSDGVALWWDIY